MHYSIKRKNCAIWQKTFYGGEGAQLEGSLKKINVFGGVMKKISQVRKIPPAPRDFINERSLILHSHQKVKLSQKWCKI